MTEVIVVPRAPFTPADPFVPPAGAVTIALVDATDGSSPRLGTRLDLWFDETSLTALFQADDDRVVATMLEHDAPLYQEDVVELFLSPDPPVRYYEIEVSPLGTTFDARVDSPDGERSTMTVDTSWTCERLFAAVRKVTMPQGLRVDTLVRIPFESLGRQTPRPGELWRANFYRIDRGDAGDEFTAWNPTLRVPANFHVPVAFGTLRFQ